MFRPDHYYSSYRSLSWENELIYRDMDGETYKPGEVPNATRKKQGGYYSQLTYTHNQNWRAGLRYDDIYKNDVNGNEINAGDRYSIMAEYNPSEFSRIRLQYNVNRALFEHDDATDSYIQKDLKSVIVQFNYAIGAHGAHAF